MIANYLVSNKFTMCFERQVREQTLLYKEHIILKTMMHIMLAIGCQAQLDKNLNAQA